MPLTRPPRLFRWSSALLSLSLVSACSQSRDMALSPARRAEATPRARADSEASMGAPLQAPAAASVEAPRDAPTPKVATIDFGSDHIEGELARPEEASLMTETPAPPPPPGKPRPSSPEPARASQSASGSLGSLGSLGSGSGRGAGGLMGGVAGGRMGPVADRKARLAEELALAEPRSSGNSFTRHAPNPFTETDEDALSTFAVDVDTASYTLARRYLSEGALPPPAAVRVEEFVNYFKYRYTPPERGAFTVHMEGAPSPFASGRHFLRVGVQGKVVSRSQRKPAHLVFLVDTSGSMNSADRLPLAREAMKIAVKNLLENDTVAIVTYAGSTRDVLPPTPATDHERIRAAIDSLQSGGGTAMGSGMELAYKHAVRKASGSVVSRVVVLTDGDTNIGPNLSADSMLESVKRYVAEGVTLSMVGFGMGNYRDDLMEKLADKGNGNCFYIDGYREAKRVFETQLTGTLEVIAKDVKIQVQLNPKAVRRYRLVGYENRDVADQDFRNDKVDAGEIGAGHSVTALYEVELTGDGSEPLGTVRIRAKEPHGTAATEQAFSFEQRLVRPTLEATSADFRFALAVAAVADVLRESPSARGWSLGLAQKLAEGANEGLAERVEFAKLVAQARRLKGSAVAGSAP